MRMSKTVDFQTLKRLINSEFKDHRRRYFTALLFMSVSAACGALAAWIIESVINEIFVGQKSEMVIPIALAIVGIYVLRGISAFISSYQLAQIGAAIIAKLREQAIISVFAREIYFFDNFDRSEIINRVTNATRAAGDAFNTATTTVARDALSVVFLVALMVYQDWLLALMSLLVGPPLVFGVGRLSKRIRKSVAGEFSDNSGLLQLLTERLSGIRLVKAYNLENKTEKDAQKIVRSLEKRAVRIGKAKALSSPLTESFGGIAVAMIIIYGGYSIIELGRDPGSFFSFIVAFLMAYEPVKRLANVRVKLVNQLLPVQLLYNLLDMPSHENAGRQKLNITNGDISFQNVSFSYGENAPAINNLDIVAKGGEMLALVGQSGSGKSTIFSLLMQFYYPSSGQILIDGTDLANISTADLRDKVAYISQDTILFSGSIADNIRLGKADVNLESLKQAAKAANILDFIESLPNGFESNVGQDGVSLSGGQRQRIAIARAILKDAPIILMDEATSALDSESEVKVQNALERAAQGKTVLVIAHRLSTIRNADKIVVMHGGRVVETGAHDELLEKQGPFRALYDMQFAAT